MFRRKKLNFKIHCSRFGLRKSLFMIETDASRMPGGKGQMMEKVRSEERRVKSDRQGSNNLGE